MAKKIDNAEEEQEEQPSALEGKNADNDTTGAGVTVPEEFQQKTHELLCDANEDHLAHVSGAVSKRHDELRAVKQKNKPKNMSMDDAPVSMND